jgi:hypothetical protein
MDISSDDSHSDTSSKLSREFISTTEGMRKIGEPVPEKILKQRRIIENKLKPPLGRRFNSR